MANSSSSHPPEINRSADPDYDYDPPDVPPFRPEYRGSGVLLHVTSLPSRYGFGDVGPAAMK